jgi:malate synthase
MLSSDIPVLPAGIEITASVTLEQATILTPDALAFIAGLQRKFGERRNLLLGLRSQRQAALDRGKLPQFLDETRSIRDDPTWHVAATPTDLQKRWVEITGPTDRKMLINALNSGANVFMADFEDANSPTWNNMVDGQFNLREAIDHRLSYTSPEGKEYRLNDKVAVLMARPRGWHLEEKHVCVDGHPVSASLFDFGLFFFHNARRLITKGTGPYFYLPKIESYLEARLWNDVFNHSQDQLKISQGTIRATVLIETILAAFEMEEILYELREHITGLNAGRWDYIFSIIKKFRNQPDFVLPDRAQITMTVPFMRAYSQQLVNNCHKRGAHAIGGMAAYIPSRKDPVINEKALARVRDDKLREVSDGFDGTWVAHPDLVPVAMEVFQTALGDKPHQKIRLREDNHVDSQDLIDFRVHGGEITEAGVRTNINVGILYLESWLRGVGAAALYSLMEDAATAEISRAQLWQWIHHHNGVLNDGRVISREFVHRLLMEELEKIKDLVGFTAYSQGKFIQATQLFEQLVIHGEFVDFLTSHAYQTLD